jgi:hypothetical protein
MTRDPTRAHEAIELEILEEKAATLARATAKLEATLAALAALDETPAAQPTGTGAAPDPAPAAPTAAEAARQRDDLVREAAEALWFVVVQREAIGLTSHDGLYQTHPVPDLVRRLMGPRRRRP